MVSLGVADRAEYHVKAHSERQPATLYPNMVTANGPPTLGIAHLKTSAVFGHLGGRLVIPNAG